MLIIPCYFLSYLKVIIDVFNANGGSASIPAGEVILRNIYVTTGSSFDPTRSVVFSKIFGLYWMQIA